MSFAFATFAGGEKFIQDFGGGNPKAIGYLEDLCEEGRTVLQWISKAYNWLAWTELM